MSKNILKHKALLFAAILIAFQYSVAFCQNIQDKFESGNSLYKSGQFASAIPIFEEVLSTKKNDSEILSKLAICYVVVNDTKKALETYKILFSKGNPSTADKLLYAQVLADNEKRYLASVNYDRYTLEARNNVSPPSSTQFIKNDNSNWEIKPFSSNSLREDVGASFYKDGLVFSSTRINPAKKVSFYDWDQSSILDLYFVENINSKEPINMATPFDASLNTKFNDGPATFSSDFQEMIFTRNYSDGKKLIRGSNGISNLKLFTSKSSNDRWGEPSPITFNLFNYFITINSGEIDTTISRNILLVDKEFSVCHPTITDDHKYLFFASDAPIGYGGFDIYMSEWIDERWSAPVNCGNKINSPGNEIFPFIKENNEFYFSSDYWRGLGGLDIFSSEIKSIENAKVLFTEPKNIGAPFNSNKDDFSYIVNKENELGYFTSNREGDGFNDEIYQFKYVGTKSIIIRGIVIQDSTGNPIEDVQLTLKSGNEQVESLITPKYGQYNFSKATPGKLYELTAAKEGYISYSTNLVAVNLKRGDTIYTKIKLKPEIRIVDTIQNLIVENTKSNIVTNESTQRSTNNLKNNSTTDKVQPANNDLFSGIFGNDSKPSASASNITTTASSKTENTKPSNDLFSELFGNDSKPSSSTTNMTTSTSTKTGDLFGESSSGNLNPNSTCAIKGNVYMSGSQDVLNGAKLKLKSNGKELDSMITVVNGGFMFSRIPSGVDYEVYISRKGYFDQKVSINSKGLLPGQTGTIKINLVRDPSKSDVIEPELVFPISGKVYNLSKSPISNATIFITNNIDNTIIEVNSNDKGEYSASLLRQRHYTVHAEKGQCKSNSIIKSTIGQNNSTSFNVDLILQCK